MLTTQRLILTEVTTDDASFMLDIVNSPGWLTFIGDKGIRDLNAARSYIKEVYTSSYEKYGYGLYKFSLRNTGTPIGISGLVNRPHLAHVDIGFALLPEYSGQGFAFEATKAVLEYAQQALNLSPIWAITLPDNTKSQQLLEKLGMQHIRYTTPEENKDRLLLYSTEVD